MPPVFVDTSALYAVLDADDPNHTEARQRWLSLADWTSFLVMRAQAITTAFAFDADVTGHGFQLLD